MGCDGVALPVLNVRRLDSEEIVVRNWLQDNQDSIIPLPQPLAALIWVKCICSEHQELKSWYNLSLYNLE
jgi:hypothetical protein